MAQLRYKPGFDNRLREAQGPRSLEEFAKASGVAASQLSRYGDPDGPRPRRGTLARIVKSACGGPVRAEWLATGEGPKRDGLPAGRGTASGGDVALPPAGIPVLSGVAAESPDRMALETPAPAERWEEISRTREGDVEVIIRRRCGIARAE